MAKDKEWIKREEAISAVWEVSKRVPTMAIRAKAALEDLQAAHDLEKIVHCKDCKHRYVGGNGTTQYYVCDFMEAQYEENGFCHHGERKEP